jgi:hypothetical protein
MKKESNALSGLRIRALTGGERERGVDSCAGEAAPLGY